MHDKGRVLLVDDDREIALGLSLRLKKAGYDVVTAHDGQQGLASAAERQPDVIVLDVRMPNMDGLTALEKLRQNAETAEIPVVMLSASVVDQKKALDLGARYFLEKPYEAKTVVTAIESAVKQAAEKG